MPWVRRFSTAVVTITTAFLVYTAYMVLAVRQIARVIQCPISSSNPGLPRYVEAFGLLFPMWLIVILWSIVPMIWLTVEVYVRIQRWERGKHEMCVDCGYRLTSWRGKCPGCGVRIGPG